MTKRQLILLFTMVSFLQPVFAVEKSDPYRKISSEEPAQSSLLLNSEKIEILNPALGNDHRTKVRLIQTAMTPSKIELRIACLKQKQVCRDKEFITDGISAASDGGLELSVHMQCMEWGYKQVRENRPFVVYFEDSSKLKGDEKRNFDLFCDDASGADKVHFQPNYDEVSYCSPQAAKITKSIKKRFLIKNQTVFAVYNDGKDPCAAPQGE